MPIRPPEASVVLSPRLCPERRDGRVTLWEQRLPLGWTQAGPRGRWNRRTKEVRGPAVTLHLDTAGSERWPRGRRSHRSAPELAAGSRRGSGSRRLEAQPRDPSSGTGDVAAGRKRERMLRGRRRCTEISWETGLAGGAGPGRERRL